MKNEDLADWWIDYLEDELDPELKKDLFLLLMRSTKAQEQYQGWKRIRQQIKEADPVLLPESGHYYEELNQKITALCQSSASEPPVDPLHSAKTCSNSKAFGNHDQ